MSEDKPQPQQWKGTDIPDLSNADLLEANTKLTEMLAFNEKQKQDERYLKRFANQPAPDINPQFSKLKTEIENELQKRGLNQ
jgi:hypothetical protein